MQKTNVSYASYWRKSLLDAESGKGAFKDASSLLKETKQRPLEEYEVGYLDDVTTAELFLGEPKDLPTVSITLQPQVHIARKIHGQAPTGGIPGMITPIISNANVDRSGRIYPESTFIARDLLEPLDRGSFSISDVATLDIFLTTNSFSMAYDHFDEATSTQSRDDWFKSKWAEYVSHCEKIIHEVVTEDAFTQFELANYFFIVKKDQINASMHIRSLYADVIKNGIETPLFSRYVSNTIQPTEQCLDQDALFSERLAHSGNKFHLATAQRDALNHLLTSKNGDILAVNGPPGTGKTTLLLSVVATSWANAAVEGATHQ